MATSGQNFEFSWFSEDKNIFDFSEKNNFPIEGSEIRHWTKNGFSPENKNYLRISKKKSKISPICLKVAYFWGQSVFEKNMYPVLLGAVGKISKNPA